MHTNLTIVNVDTDSFTACKPDMSPWNKEEIDLFIKDVNAQFPELIKFEDDGYYTRVVVFGSKNYALKLHKDWCKPNDLDKNGNPKIKLKGSSIRDQKKEPALREMMEKMIKCMIDDTFDIIPSIYKSYVKEAMNVKDIHRWCSKKNVSSSVVACKDYTEQDITDKKVRRNETNVWDAIKHIEGLQENDRYYVYPVILGTQTVPGGVSEKTGKPLKDKVKEVTGLRLESEWTQDEDKLKLVERVFATVTIFSSVLDMEQYIDYSSKRNSKQLEELLNVAT